MASEFNLFRKIFHFSGIIIVLIYYFNIFENFPANLFRENTRSVLFFLLSAAYIGMGFIEILRFRIPAVQSYFMRFIGKIMKPEEASKTHGSLPFFLGLTICIALFSKEVTIISFLYLMLGDPSAAWFGGRYGKHKFKNGKSLEGLAAGITGAFLAGLVFSLLDLKFNPDGNFADLFLHHPLSFLTMLLSGAVTGFLFELISTRGFFDDNLLIPVMSGLVMSIFLILILNQNPDRIFYSLSSLIIPR